MAIHLQGDAGCVMVLAIFVVPAIVAAVIFQSAIWLLIAPIAVLAAWIVLALWKGKRTVTPEQFADELERHLLGTDGGRGWDNTTSIAIKDKGLDRLRSKLSKFDGLSLEERRAELIAIISALRRGEIPEVTDD